MTFNTVQESKGSTALIAIIMIFVATKILPTYVAQRTTKYLLLIKDLLDLMDHESACPAVTTQAVKNRSTQLLLRLLQTDKQTLIGK